MEPAPPTSPPLKEFVSPRKKRKMSHFSESEKEMIINVFKYVKESWPVNKYSSKKEMKEKTADILGISKSAIYRILKEYTETDPVQPAASPKKRHSLIEKIDDFDKSCIRRLVHRFYLKGELPTAKKVLHLINEDESLPNMGLTSLKKLLKHLNFKYVKLRGNYGLIDRDDIALWRIKYLKNMKTYREQQRPIYYLGETWVNAGHTVDKVWEDTTVQSRKEAFWESLSTGAKNPTSKGKWLIVLHIGSEKGFVPESELFFERNNTGDYPESMKADMFENWFQAILPRLDPNAVVVMNYTSYHSRPQEKIPITCWKKQDIQEWLSSKHISFKSKETKVQLLEKVKDVKIQYQSYVVDEMAKAVGVELLRLPPYHCELNPIELVWGDVKVYVARKNTTFKMADVRKLLQEALCNISAEKWQSCISHVKKEELKLGRLDENVDKTVDSFDINVTGDTSSDSSYSDTEESDLSKIKIQVHTGGCYKNDAYNDDTKMSIRHLTNDINETVNRLVDIGHEIFDDEADAAVDRIKDEIEPRKWFVVDSESTLKRIQKIYDRNSHESNQESIDDQNVNIIVAEKKNRHEKNREENKKSTEDGQNEATEMETETSNNTDLYSIVPFKQEFVDFPIKEELDDIDAYFDFDESTAAMEVTFDENTSKPRPTIVSYDKDKSYLEVVVCLEDWGKRLESSKSYCGNCKTLFPTPSALDYHNMTAHSLLAPMINPAAISTTGRSIPVPKNIPKKSTSSIDIAKSTHCSHCNGNFKDNTALIKHLYELLPQQYNCNICNETFSCQSDLASHSAVHVNAEPRKIKRMAKNNLDQNPMLRNLLTQEAKTIPISAKNNTQNRSV